LATIAQISSGEGKVESRVWLGDPLPAAVDPNLSFAISRFITFKGLLYVTGRCSHSTEVLVSWFVVFSTGVAVNLMRVEPGQDFDFDARIEIPSDANFDIRFGFELSDGTKYLIDSPQVNGPKSSFDRVLDRFGELALEMSAFDHVLEIGSRVGFNEINVQQAIIRGLLPKEITYVGLDITEGANVDVVGDAHSLSRHFDPERFAAIYSLAVFEHLIMPWKAAVEMNRVMKLGGIAYVMSHQTFPLHDEPWDFWRFSDKAWQAIFNRFTGFEIVDAGLAARAYIAGDYMGLVTFRMDEVPAYLLCNVLVRKTGPSLVDWPVDAAELLASAYPR
jgi:hypothetical protein